MGGTTPQPPAPSGNSSTYCTGRELLISGVVGNVTSVDFHWLLDTHHGADYFRRWHRHKRNSGGLLVHKATHQFDLINWWLSTVPETVFATGARNFYRPETADYPPMPDPTEAIDPLPLKHSTAVRG